MGWFGWTPEIALATDVRHVTMAIAGRVELIQMENGVDPDKASKGGSGGKVTADKWKAWARRHNSARKAVVNG